MSVIKAGGSLLPMTSPPVEIKARMLSTSIDYDDPTASLGIALSMIDDFRVRKSRAMEICKTRDLI